MKKTILSLSFILLTIASCSNVDEISPTTETPASTGAIKQIAIGGSNQPNQVFLDLSSETTTVINRASWDFGFSSDYRITINGAIKMAVKQLATTDMSVPQTIDVNVAVGAGANLSKNGYCDNPTGVLTGEGAGIGTAIAPVSATDADNKVYLVNLGFTISTITPSKGSISIDGDARGWKKVRFLRNGNGYKIQYADLNSTTYTEKIITKDPDFNLAFFSMTTGTKVTVEPQKTKWDLGFTFFTNYVNFGSEVTYGYSDFITTNMKGGTKVYQVILTDAGSYERFTKANIEEANFSISATDQRIIGANWRNSGGPSSLPSVKTDRFYVVKDITGNYYKVKLLAMTNDLGIRGNITLQYAILN
jgi:hypothetical protein